jgi:hypothetical protein
MTADIPSIHVGESTTIRAGYAAGAGDSIANTTINIGQASVIPYSASSQRTYTFTPTSAGDVTFLAYAQTGIFPAWMVYNSTTVHVDPAPANNTPTCSMGFNPPTVGVNQNSTFAWTTAHATAFTTSVWGGLDPAGGTIAGARSGQTLTVQGTVSNTTGGGIGGGSSSPTGTCSATLTIDPSLSANSLGSTVAAVFGALGGGVAAVWSAYLSLFGL